ncbi:hypothetical protein XA68_12457 [Ophiocordyceps unilateralis]|uniref:Peptidase M43 pregnancy-associated plasma-A domain-containing protein n=1 Tax=Ophiocordyceps unilateralis TaxID=268505 RepID=A0A2A9PEN4_OPHUN|nr:hypothetical protein XA68_12457 [Ophiocordyceps unilateralis]
MLLSPVLIAAFTAAATVTARFHCGASDGITDTTEGMRALLRRAQEDDKWSYNNITAKGNETIEMKSVVHFCCVSKEDCPGNSTASQATEEKNRLLGPANIVFNLINFTQIIDKRCGAVSLKEEDMAVVDGLKARTRQGGVDTLNLMILPVKGEGSSTVGLCYLPTLDMKGKNRTISQVIGKKDGCSVFLEEYWHGNNPTDSHETGHWLGLPHVKGASQKPGLNIMLPSHDMNPTTNYTLEKDQSTIMRQIALIRLAQAKEEGDLKPAGGDLFNGTDYPGHVPGGNTGGGYGNTGKSGPRYNAAGDGNNSNVPDSETPSSPDNGSGDAPSDSNGEDDFPKDSASRKPFSVGDQDGSNGRGLGDESSNDKGATERFRGLKDGLRNKTRLSNTTSTASFTTIPTLKTRLSSPTTTAGIRPTDRTGGSRGSSVSSRLGGFGGDAKSSRQLGQELRPHTTRAVFPTRSGREPWKMPTPTSNLGNRRRPQRDPAGSQTKEEKAGGSRDLDANRLPAAADDASFSENLIGDPGVPKKEKNGKKVDRAGKAVTPTSSRSSGDGKARGSASTRPRDDDMNGVSSPAGREPVSDLLKKKKTVGESSSRSSSSLGGLSGAGKSVSRPASPASSDVVPSRAGRKGQSPSDGRSPTSFGPRPSSFASSDRVAPSRPRKEAQSLPDERSPTSSRTRPPSPTSSDRVPSRAGRKAQSPSDGRSLTSSRTRPPSPTSSNRAPSRPGREAQSFPNGRSLTSSRTRPPSPASSSTSPPRRSKETLGNVDTTSPSQSPSRIRQDLGGSGGSGIKGPPIPQQSSSPSSPSGGSGPRRKTTLEKNDQRPNIPKSPLPATVPKDPAASSLNVAPSRRRRESPNAAGSFGGGADRTSSAVESNPRRPETTHSTGDGATWPSSSRGGASRSRGPSQSPQRPNKSIDGQTPSTGSSSGDAGAAAKQHPPSVRGSLGGSGSGSRPVR